MPAHSTPATFTPSILPMRSRPAPGAPRGVVAPESLLRAYPGVRSTEVTAAIDALRQIPAADRALLAQAGLKVDLLPTARLENADGKPMIGATQVEQEGSSPWVPKSIRIAAHAGVTSSPTRHIVAHEVGHAVEVLRRQDRTEEAAEGYVLRVLRSGADQAITAARIRSERVAAAREAGSASSHMGLGLGIASAAAVTLMAALLLAT